MFIARLLPLARTFVSLPVGHVRVPFWRFILLTVAGCAIWSAAFVLAGVLAGAGWQAIATTAGRASVMLAAVSLTAALVWARFSSPE